MEPLVDKLKPEEKARNKHGPHLQYVYVPKELEPYRSTASDKFPDVLHNHAKYVDAT
jgi:5'-3' exoribonuclease 1